MSWNSRNYFSWDFFSYAQAWILDSEAAGPESSTALCLEEFTRWWYQLNVRQLQCLVKFVRIQHRGEVFHLRLPCFVCGCSSGRLRIAAVRNLLLLSTRHSYATLRLVTGRTRKRILTYLCLRLHLHENADFTATMRHSLATSKLYTLLDTCIAGPWIVRLINWLD